MGPCDVANSPERKRVFISYGHDELSSLAKRIKKDLEARGHEVWFDEDRIPAGADWEQNIEGGIDWASEGDNGRIILLMTPYSVRRPDGYCLNEVARAVQKNIKIIPVMLVWCEPPLSICRIQWLDMQDCVPLEERQERYEAKFHILADALEKDRIDFEGFQAQLFVALNPLSFDAEIRQNLDRFTGREWVIREIDRWLATNGSRVFWIAGSPGVGKTAISTWLCANRREIAAFHFCRYDNVQKIDPRRCVTSIAYQLSTQLPEYAERLKRVKLEGLGDLNARTLFDQLIVQPLTVIPKPERSVLILIDALDEATAGGKNQLADFIASEFERTPEWLNLIVTSRPDPEITGTLQAYSPYILDISDTRNIEDLRRFLTAELAKPGGPVPEATIDAILEKSGGLFLYAEWIVRELAGGRLSLEKPGEFPRGLGGIYLKFFERQFPDIGEWDVKIRPGLEALSALQEPLSLRTLTAMFGWSIHDERKFRMSLGSLFQFDRGMIQPFHKSVMEWLTNEDKSDPYFISTLEGHRILADYGWKLYRRGPESWSPYLVMYLATHLCMAEKIPELREALGNLKFIRSMWEKDRFNVLRQWTLIEERSGLRMAETYRPVIDSPEAVDVEDVFFVANLLMKAFNLDEALKLWVYLVRYYRDRADKVGLQRCLGNEAWIRIVRSEYAEAMEILREQERICRETGNLEGLQFSLLYQASILHYTDDFDRAMKLLKEQEKICRETGNLDGLQESLSLQGLVHRVKGEFNDTMALVKERERICRETGNIDGIQSSLVDQALILRAWGDLDGSLKLLGEAEAISRRIGNKDAIQSIIGARAIIYRWRGDLDRAMALAKEQGRISRELGNMFSLGESLAEQGVILYLMGDQDGAIKVFNEKEAMSHRLNDRFGLQNSYGVKADIYRDRGDLRRALELHLEEERICREIGHRRDQAVSQSHRAEILRLMGDLDGALALHKEAERTFRDIGYRYGLQECLGFEAMTLLEMGDPGGALALLMEQERICREMGVKLDLRKCLDNQKIVAGEKDLVPG